MSKTESTLHKKTPSVTVLSNRGQVVRDIVYHRHPDTPDNTDERITRHQFDARGFLQQSADPRMQASGLSNFRYITSLSGQVLRTESADAGTSLALNDAAGRPVVSISQIRTDNGQDDRSRAVTQTFRYEGADSAGRLLSIAEHSAGQSAQVTERFVYAGNSEAEKARNLAGVCTHHYDPAGLMQTDSIALTGIPLSVTRQLLKDADNPDIAVNWPESNPESLLSVEKYTIQTTADATGAVLNTTDAAGHQQRVTYDIAGLLNTSRVTVKGGTEKIIIKSVTYSAAGQKLREEHGNNVVTTYTYEEQTQRLIAVKTEHPARKKIFQDLRYEYDPVGNVLCVTNDAEETRFWHNQKVVPENRYTYDTLYQLVSATGREMANAGQQSGSLPDISPFDKASYTNYTRNYVYDRAGNMTQIRHSAPATNNNYTTDITVSQRSNRAVLKTLADTPEKAEALFTPGGQQTQLQPGQALSWTARGELKQVTPVVRNGAAGDRESYRYDAGSQRILKTAVQKTGNSTQTQQVIYLPGLELRSGKENYQVICAGVAGRAQVRLLHWPDGKKDHQRFSYDNLIGSSGLETDGDGNLLSQEEYYPFGGTAVLVADADSGIDYKTHRYSGKERDATGLYYYGYRYYQPWAGRWLSSDPAGTVDGLNLFRMVRNNPVTLRDDDGLAPKKAENGYYYHLTNAKNLISIAEKGFIPQGSQGPTLSAGDLENRQKGIIRYIHNKVAAELNRGVIRKNQISANNFKMPSDFWPVFKSEGSSIVGDKNIESVNEKLNNAVMQGISGITDKALFKTKHRETKSVDITEARMAIMNDAEIRDIITQKPHLEQQREAENTSGYIYLAATKNTLEKYANNYKSSGDNMILLAITENIFSENMLEEDLQEPDSAVRYKGGISAADLRFINRKGQAVSFESSAADEIILGHSAVINFIRKHDVSSHVKK